MRSPGSRKKRRRRVALVGRPNVGKSAIFNALTGRHAIVSNYPGTTVEVARGIVRFGEVEVEIVDTPGIYSLLPVTEEERVARRLLMQDSPDLLVQIADAKDLGRCLPFTVQLVEAGFTPVLVANMEDEAREMGIDIDVARVERLLGIPVVLASAVKDGGIDDLRRRLVECMASMNKT